MKLLLIFILIFNLSETTLSLSADGLSLLSLKSAVDDTVSALASWNESDSTPCAWSGVTCAAISGNSEPRVVGLALPNQNLSGYIPSELGTLIFLRRINLRNNAFHGPIPSQLFNATSLHTITLSSNLLSGPLPSSLCSLPRLQNLDLSRNRIFGVLTPNILSRCISLQRLDLSNNNLSGSIPGQIWSGMKHLVQLDLSSNKFSGEIPPEIGELKSLSGVLNLSFNQLSGKIPEQLGDLPLSVSFDLRGNNFNGEIPQTGTFTNQGPTAFLGNPLLCGFPLKKKCNGSAGGGAGGRGVVGSGVKKGLRPSLIVVIAVADAVGVALVGLVVVYVYWRREDSGGGGCSCTGKKKLGGNGKGGGCFCMGMDGRNEAVSDGEEERDVGGSGRGGGEGELVAIDKGFRFELDELLRASAYVLGKSGLGIVYKVVLANGAPVAVRRLGEGGEQRYKEFSAEVQAIARVKHPNIVRLRAYYWRKMMLRWSNCPLRMIRSSRKPRSSRKDPCMRIRRSPLTPIQLPLKNPKNLLVN